MSTVLGTHAPSYLNHFPKPNETTKSTTENYLQSFEPYAPGDTTFTDHLTQLPFAQITEISNTIVLVIVSMADKYDGTKN